jgi:hypothetical protein
VINTIDGVCGITVKKSASIDSLRRSAMLWIEPDYPPRPL